MRASRAQLVPHNLVHPWSVNRAPLPYQLDPEQCYKYNDSKPNSTTVAVLLLPHVPGYMPALHGGGLSRLLANTPADVVLFHTGWSLADLNALRTAVPHMFRALCIANVDWDVGEHAFSWELIQQHYHGHGYRSMCRWYSRRVFNVVAGLGYRWVIRLDTDSNLPEPVPYNLVQAMLSRKAKYGLRAVQEESPDVVISLPEAAQYWLASQRTAPQPWILQHCKPHTVQGIPNWNRTIIYNNFFVTDVGFWMQPKVQGWLMYLEQLRGFHKFRWGDAPVHTWTAGMFLRKEELLEFRFAYEHQGNWSLNQSGNSTFQNFP